MRAVLYCLPLILVCLACQGPPQPTGLLELFPDSSGMRRTFEVQRADGGNFRYQLETAIVDTREAGRKGLAFNDPRHRGLVGNPQLIVHERSMELLLPDFSLTMGLLDWPLEADSSLVEYLPGFQARKLGWQHLERADERNLWAFGMEYLVNEELLRRFGVDAMGQQLEFRLWLAPGIGPVRFESGDTYREELVR